MVRKSARKTQLTAEMSAVTAINFRRPVNREPEIQGEKQVTGQPMLDLAKFRSGKPGSYPDQSIYAEFACAELGLAFTDIDGGTGQVFSVASQTRQMHFGAGRCAWYPQNNATAATLASDKYFTDRILQRAGVATLGGEYFFLLERYRAHRPGGHEIDDALKYFTQLRHTAFAKPLMGSRGDFAQAIHDEAALIRYLR